jgi:hypothetical protein
MITWILLILFSPKKILGKTFMKTSPLIQTRFLENKSLAGRRTENLDELQDSIDRTLKAIYPYLSEGASWTNPNASPDSIFRIVPR